MRKAKNHVPPEPRLSEDYEEFEEQMFAIETAPDVSMKKLFGVSFEELPPPYKRIDKQMQQLIDTIVKTWEAFNPALFMNGTSPHRR